MKKLFITIAFVAATMFASAQLYVGGSLGMTTNGGTIKTKAGNETKTRDQDKSFSFTFAPEAGFMFADNMGAGLKLNFGLTKVTSKDEDVDPVETTVDKTTTIGFTPYFRYVFAEVDNFKFYADAQVEFGIVKPQTKVTGGNDPGTTDNPKTTNFGFGIVPGMAYQLTDNISMNCELHILKLGFNTSKTVAKDVIVGYDMTGPVKGDRTTTDNEFGFGVNEASPITIGFFYTF